MFSSLLSCAALLGCAEQPDAAADELSDSLAQPPLSPAAQVAKRQADIDDVVRRTPGARQISANRIELAPGLEMKVALPGGATTNVQDDECPAFYLCAYEHSDFAGHELNFTTCNREWNLGNYAFPGGGVWNDRISSVINNQSSGTNSYLYDYRGGSSWARIISIGAGHYLRNLASDTAEGGGSPNDRTDGVHVCGGVPSPWKPNWP